MNVNWILDSAVAQLPATDAARIAISFDGTARESYGELHEHSLRLARALLDLGLAKGDRVAMLLYNDPEYIPLYLAAARIGLISVRMNFRLTAAELGFILEDSGTRAVVVHASLADRLGEIRDGLPALEQVVVLGDGDPAERRPEQPPAWAVPYAQFADRLPLLPDEAPAVAPEDPIALAYTSGTTGTPKGALWTHANTIATATMQALKWRFSEDTVAFVPGPVYHVGGFEAAQAPALLRHGTAVCLRSGNFTADRLFEVLRSEQVTDCLLYSFMVDEMIRRDDLETVLSPSVRRFMVGGDTLMPRTAEAVQRRLPHVDLCQVYGSTEGGCLSTTIDGRDLLAQPKSIGRPLPFAEVRITRPDGSPAAVDEVGEIEVRSPSVATAYWNRPRASAETFHDGWCRSGDLGSVNGAGFLSLNGRSKDMIRSGAENIYPAEVEKVLTRCPGVVDAAVIAVPDARYTEVGAAIVLVEQPGALGEETMRDFCRESLARYKVPKYFVVADELPRNASGKVLKYVLRDRYRHLGDPVATDPAASQRS